MRFLAGIAYLSSVTLADLLGPRYPYPKDLSSNSSRVALQWRNLTASLDEALSAPTSGDSVQLKDITFSLGIFSPHDPLAATAPTVQYHYTAPNIANSSYGVKKVDGDSVYRIASITKLITMLTGLLNIDSTDWDRPVTDFLPNLRTSSSGSDDLTQNVQWDKVTVMALASHLGGIPRDAFGYAPGEILLGIQAQNLPLASPLDIGLPLLDFEESLAAEICSQDPEEFLVCGVNVENYTKSIQHRPPTFVPWASPAYANNGYILLGYIIQSITGKPIEDLYQDSIFGPLGMERSGAVAPRESEWPRYVIPDEAVSVFRDDSLPPARASGGVLSTLHELSKLGVAILNHTLLSREETNKWMKPRTHTDQLQVSIGAPWEIFRHTSRDNGVVTDLYCKSGDSGAFSSWMCILPDFDMGFTILGASSPTATTRSQLIGLVGDMVVENLVSALTEQAAIEAKQNFAGVYKSSQKGFNSSITITVSTTKGAPPGLTISEFISNGTDIFAAEEKLGLKVLPGNRLTPTIINPETAKVSFRAIPASRLPPASFGQLSSLSSLGWTAVGAGTYGNIDTDLFIFDTTCKGRAISVSPVAWRATYVRE